MLNTAIKAARRAGSIINRASNNLDILQIENKTHNDYVSEVDRAAEAAIIETLLGAYPQHSILGEESGAQDNNSEYLWIIDPLDGTTNFLHGFPVYAVSIALAFRGVVQQAVVYDPTRNDLFYASRGRGAFLNDKRLRVSKRTRLADCLIGTGFPFRKGDNVQRYLKMFETVMQACAGLRRPGAAALDLCYVAAGWYDGFFETGLNPWDLAAGSLIITEAGGLVGNFTGEADFLYQREVVAGNPKIYGQLVTLLAAYTKVIKADEAADSLAGMVAEAGLGATIGTAIDALASGGGSANGPAGMLATTPAKALPKRQAKNPAATTDGDAAATTAASPATSAETAPVERERKPVRIRKFDAPSDGLSMPTIDRSASPRRDGPQQRGPRQDGGDRQNGPRGPRQDGERERPAGPMPGRPLPVKR
jgi:myo-inositol-1(or 4)-monophosphatase